MSAKHTPGHIAHDPTNPDWWLQQARTERAFARESMQSVDSIQIHLRQAEEYERQAKRAAITKATVSAS